MEHSRSHTTCLQRIAEAAVSELLAAVPGLLEAPEQVGRVANLAASKYPTGAAEFAPGVQMTHTAQQVH
jgi:hypothetical protein